MLKTAHYIFIIAITLLGFEALARPCAYLEQIEIVDNGIISKFKLREWQERYGRRCLSKDSIKELLKEVANQYIKMGYITTKVYIEPKKPGDKILKIHAAPGVVGNSDFISKGTPFNIRDVEQEIDQISKLRGYSARAIIAPGEHLNESDVALQISHGNWLQGAAFIDNYGTKGNGVNQGDISVQVLNTLGAYEMLCLNYRYGFNDSIKKMASENVMGGISIPYGYWYFRLHMSYFDYQRILPGQYTDLRYTGSNYNYTADIERVMHRDQNSKTIISGSLILKDSNNFIQQTLLETSSRKLSILGFKIGQFRRIYGGALNVSACIQRGIRSFGAHKDRAVYNTAKAQFTKYLVDVSYAKYLLVMHHNFLWDSLLHMQASPDKLYDSEQISIGGLATIRGFREIQFTGETGWYVVNNLAYKVPDLSYSNLIGDVQLYMGVDHGMIKKNRFNNASHKSISGISIGVRNIGKPVALELAYEKPLQRAYNTGIGDIFYFRVGWLF